MRLVIVEHPLAGDVETNVAYGKRCMNDALKRDEAPFSSALLYAQPGTLDDLVPAERALGMEAGFAWGAAAELVAVYVDRGCSRGMWEGIVRARSNKTPIEVRRLDGPLTQFDQDLLKAQSVVLGSDGRVERLNGVPKKEEPERWPSWRMWVDVETTGTEPLEDKILEIAWILTRYEYPYEEIAFGSRLIASTFDARDFLKHVRPNAYVLEMHEKNGLLDELDVVTRCNLADNPELDHEAGLRHVEEELLFLSENWPTARVDKDVKVVLAGNSVDFDRGFLKVHMPRFTARLSHRVSDASAYYRFCRDLGMPARPKPEEAHRAAADVRASLELARACARWVLEENSARYY